MSVSVMAYNLAPVRTGRERRVSSTAVRARRTAGRYALMEDPYNPTEAEMRAWAYGQEIMEPVQDFDLMVADESHAELLFEFASDSKCPTKDYFLHCLYLLVGDAVRSKYRTTKKETIAHRVGLFVASADRRRGQLCTFGNPPGLHL